MVSKILLYQVIFFSFDFILVFHAYVHLFITHSFIASSFDVIIIISQNFIPNYMTGSAFKASSVPPVHEVDLKPG